jgi:salicylate hydroxylase
MSSVRKVIISGAGIAGLATALALHQRGVQVTVLEQAAALGEVGAGLQIAPNGSRVLQALGLGDAVAAVACEAAAKEVRLWNTGRRWPLFDLGADCRARFGAPYWMVHRGDLHQVLRAAFEAAAPGALHTGVRVTQAQTLGDTVLVTAADGRVFEADVMVAADGVHSAQRRAALGEGAARFTGLMAWRGVVPTERLAPALREPVGVNWVGPGGHVITYPLRRGELLNVVVIVEKPEWRNESWSDAGTRGEVHQDLPGWHADLHQLIDAMDTPFRWALLSRPPLADWRQGRTVLIGDAAHPTLPFLAQGANMALEDALLLARCLCELGSADDALARFVALRLPRTSRIVQGAADNTQRFHNPLLADPATAAAYVDREWEPSRVRQRYDWLFEHDVTRLPLDLPTSTAA